ERRRVEAQRERYLAQAETARRQAEEARRAKDVFLATVSHELRTPLTPILAWSRLLREGRLGAEKTTAGLAAVERSARAQARLIDDLLDVSRLAAREWRVVLRPMDLAPAVRTAVEVVRPAADTKGVALETVLPPLAVPVQGAVFPVELPLLASVAEEAARVQPGRQVTTAEPDAAPGAPLGGLRVLVVDDDPDSNAVVSALLVSCGAEVQTAVSAPEALEV